MKRIAKNTYYQGTPPTPAPTGLLSPTPSILPSDPYNPWQNDVVREIATTEVVERDGSLTQTLLLTLNKTYVYQLYEDEYNYYIALVRPKGGLMRGH